MKILRDLIETLQSGDTPRISGIYQIRCIPTGKIYVGSATNLQERWTHKNSIRKRDYIKTWEGFVDPNGVPVEPFTNLAAFCREHNLDDTHMIALSKGKLHVHRGWTHINKREHLGHKTYTGFLNPQGQREVITNLREFCRNNNLHPVHMHQLINRQRKSHKGWTWRPENE